jgi:hypothetical protein
MSEDEKSDKANVHELALLSSSTTSNRITSSSSSSEAILKTVMATGKQQHAKRQDTGLHANSSSSLSSVYIDLNGDVTSLAAFGLDDQHANHNEFLCAFCACNEQATLAQGLFEKHAMSNTASSLNPNELIVSIRSVNFGNNKAINKDINNDEDIKK